MWDAFRQGLRALGYLEGQNIAFEYRRADGAPERLAEAATDLARRPVDVIATYGTAPSIAAKAATTTIPIVMIGVGDVVRTGLVQGLAHPGGNITGNTILGPEVQPKRLQLFKAVVPGLSRVAGIQTDFVVRRFVPVSGRCRHRGVLRRLAVLDFTAGQGGEDLRDQLARGSGAQFDRDTFAPAVRFADEVDAERMIERRMEGMIVIDVGGVDPHPAARPLGAAQELGLLDDVRAHDDLLESQAARAAAAVARCLRKKANTLFQPSSACSGR